MGLEYGGLAKRGGLEVALHLHNRDRILTNSCRSRRKLFHQHFQARHLASYYPAQLGATVILLRKILQFPEDFISHVF